MLFSDGSGHWYFVRLRASGAAWGSRAAGSTPPAYPFLIIPSIALISTAAIPTGIASFQPMFMSWS